jgi:hypothetical protein
MEEGELAHYLGQYGPRGKVGRPHEDARHRRGDEEADPEEDMERAELRRVNVGDCCLFDVEKARLFSSRFSRDERHERNTVARKSTNVSMV